MSMDPYPDIHRLPSVAHANKFSKSDIRCLVYATNEDHGLPFAYAFYVHTGIETGFVHAQTSLMHKLRSIIVEDKEVYVIYMEHGKVINLLPDKVQKGLYLAHVHCSHIPDVLCASTDYAKYYRFMLGVVAVNRDEPVNAKTG
ncbi:hypothetical protein GGI03_006193 [Coemansia sp. RSA 2337]|nr:hypothetical protein GGI08_003584 [Coemansia sp. S2]KAJ2457109.1 hypothetical protein GGI03_006193 [Coemansia sp. RSA 2337]